MNSFAKQLAWGLAVSWAAVVLPSQALAQLRAVPTYESAGIYWPNPGAGAAASGCEVQFRRSIDVVWRQGLNLWYDARNGECRGSLVQLEADTQYDVRLNLPGAAPAQSLTFRTWPNQRQVAATIPVPSGITTLNITAGGTPAGYVVYDGMRGAVLDGQNALPYNVTINASYVIVRGLVLKNAQQDAIRISPTVTDVIIEDNEITNWGRNRPGTSFGVEQDSAIHAVCPLPTLQRVTIQRNEIHDPRYSANSWSDGHPEGPQAVSLFNCGGNHVIRHNDIFSTTGRYYNDAIGGGANETGAGFPNADSDIYGNDISNAWDDGIEAEGADTNVRIWGNYLDQTGTGIATTPATQGPIYLFRNVYNRSRLLASVPPDQDDRQVMFKSGSDPLRGDGRRYIFHNTMLQARQSGSLYGLGASGGISGTSTTTPVNNTVSRNNIFENWRTWTAYYDVGINDDFGWDMFNGSAGAPVTNPIMATPTYAAGNGWQSEDGGNYQLAAGTPGYDQGVRIANFNDVYAGAAPDVGAQEAGTPPMRYGIAASPGPAAVSMAADIAITQSATPNPAAVGKDIVFTITVTNSGAVTATGVMLTDVMPANASYVWAPTTCGRAATTVTCNVGSLAPGASASVTLVVRPSTATPSTNVATVSATPADPNSTNNSSTVVVPVGSTPAGVPVTRYRLYNTVTYEHLFTTDVNEYNYLGATYPGVWMQEGASGKVLNNPGSYNGVPATPYYRLYCSATHMHHWTADPNEYYTLVTLPCWSGEGVEGYILLQPAPGTVQLWRLYYPDNRGLHHWTVDRNEYDVLTLQYGWQGEGSAGYLIQ